MQTSIIGVANLPFNSPAEVSNVLRNLGVRHSVLVSIGHMCNVRGTIESQPARVVVATSVGVVSSLARVARKPLIILLCIPIEIMESYNVEGIESFPNNDLDNAIRYLLHYYVDNPQPYTFAMKRMTAVENLEQISPPTFLDFYQDVQCKINPYALRKEAHAQALRYLMGNLSRQGFRAYLGANHKLTKFGNLVLEKGESLRNVLQRIKDGTPMSEAISDTEVTEFEVRYVTSSLKNIG